MAFRKHVDERLERKEREYETDQLLKRKRSEEYEVLEEVFDKSTLMVIYGLLNKGIIDEIHGVVKAGKEARIYWGKDKTGKELAIKIYLTIAGDFKKGKIQYIEGDPRFTHMKHDTRSIVFSWALKEFKNLHLALKAKVKVPRPIAIKKNVLVMQFIGKNGNPAPRLKEFPPKKPDFIYSELLEYIKRLYHRAQLIHSDVSEYNVMVWRGKPILFDMAQAVLRSHPMATVFLQRDLQNLNRYFKRLGVKTLSPLETYNKVTQNGES